MIIIDQCEKKSKPDPQKKNIAKKVSTFTEFYKKMQNVTVIS